MQAVIVHHVLRRRPRRWPRRRRRRRSSQPSEIGLRPSLFFDGRLSAVHRLDRGLPEVLKACRVDGDAASALLLRLLLRRRRVRVVVAALVFVVFQLAFDVYATVFECRDDGADLGEHAARVEEDVSSNGCVHEVSFVEPDDDALCRVDVAFWRGGRLHHSSGCLHPHRQRGAHTLPDLVVLRRPLHVVGRRRSGAG